MSADDREWQRAGSLLAEHWDFSVTEHEWLSGGRNGRTWRVTGPAGTAVAKLVGPAEANLGQFEGSLHVAAVIDRQDLPTAPPIPSRDGRLVVPAGHGWLALLRWLDGRPLSGTADADLGRMGAALAFLHRRAASVAVPDGIRAWPWSWLCLETLGLEPLDPRDAGLLDRAAREAAGCYQPALVHGDPTPDHFLAVDEAVGVIDWATVMEGPPGYDLAVLALTAQRAGARPGQIRRLIASYNTAADATGRDARAAVRVGSAASRASDAAGLARMRALRLAAEIVYFTSRLRHPPVARMSVDEDVAGLARARTALTERG